MALFTETPTGGYAQRQMPKPAHADGPWGEAIVYWLNERGWRQADLVKASKTTLTKNTVSAAARGLDVGTMTLRLIAAILEVPVEDVLVSPARKSDSAARKQEIQEITEHVYNRLTAAPEPAATTAHKPPSAVVIQKLARKAKRRVPPIAKKRQLRKKT